MKTFSRLSLFTLVCLGFALMLVGSTVEAQVPSLEVASLTKGNVGELVRVTFKALDPDTTNNNVGILLKIDSTGDVTIESVGGAEVGTIPGKYPTGPAGNLVVEGRITGNGEAEISAEWEEKRLSVQADPIGRILPPAVPTVIVVNEPDESSLKVGDTFTQTIEIQGVDAEGDPDLSSWQMSVVYNVAVLKVKDVNKGTFLPESAFTHTSLEDANGKVTVSQSVLGGSPGVVGSGTLVTLTFEVLEIADEVLGVHDVLLLNSVDQKLTYSISIKGPAIVIDSFAVEDVNRDRVVNIQDLVLVAQSIGTADSTRVDVNGDGFVNIRDLVMVAAKVSPAAPAPAAPLARSNGNINPRTIQEWIQLAQVEDDGSAIFDLGIANLEALIASRIPSDTRLLLNYPNPFNPETWIPYQLAEATDVRVMIHSVNGSLIRMLELGHQAAGTYKNKSQAAYWDGRNELGEQVASGLYFYTLTAGDFSATGKMLIRK